MQLMCSMNLSHFYTANRNLANSKLQMYLIFVSEIDCKVVLKSVIFQVAICNCKRNVSYHTLHRVRLAQCIRQLNYLTTHTSLSPIRRGFAPSFVNYKKGCTRLAAQVIKFTSCLPMVGGSLRVLWLLPPLKLVAMTQLKYC